MNKTTAFDLEYLKQILDRKVERKDEGSRGKDRPTSRQEGRSNYKRKQNKLANILLDRDKRKLLIGTGTLQIKKIIETQNFLNKQMITEFCTPAELRLCCLSAYGMEIN